MKLPKLTFLASVSLALASGLGTGDIEAREKVPLFKVKVGDKPGDELNEDSRGQYYGGMNKGPREKQIAGLHKKRRGLRDQLGKALQKDDQQKAKKVAAKLQSVERQLSQLARIERENRQAGPLQNRSSSVSDPVARKQAIGNVPDDPTWFWKRKCKGCGTRHGKPHCPTFGINPGQRGDVLKPIDCNCHGTGCGYCSPDGLPPDGQANVGNRPNSPPVLLTRPRQDRSELAPGSGGEFNGKKRKRCLTCGKKHKINGGKCPSVGNDDLPNSQNVRPVGQGGSSQTSRGIQRPSRGSGLFSRSGRSGLSTRGISRSVPVRQSRSTGRPSPVRRPKSTTRSIPVRRPKPRVSQKVKPVRKPR